MQSERIATLLASGLPDAAVSTIVGLSPARISQLKKEEPFQLLLQAKLAELKDKDQEETSLSAKYLAAEHALLKQVTEMAPTSELRDVVGALRVVAERQEKAKSRQNPIVQSSPVYNTVVQLQLPAHATPELSFGGAKEVIAIENRNLAPLSSTGVVGLFKSMDQVERVTADEGEGNEPTRVLGSPEESSGQDLPSKNLRESLEHTAKAAGKFLDSLHPAPFAPQF